MILREINFLIKKFPIDSLLTPLWRVLTWPEK